MKRVYWLLIAAVPVVLWWLSQSGSHQEVQPAPAKPEEAEKPATAPEPVKEVPVSSSNGSYAKAAPVEAPPVEEAAPPEAVAETAPPHIPQIEVPAPSEPAPMDPPAPSEPAAGEKIQLFDSKDRALECHLVEITASQALVRIPEVLPEKEKTRLVLPHGAEAITVNGQLLGVEDGVSRFKIMTMKSGQKKRFEEYLSQRPGL